MKTKLEIRKITAKETWPLRHTIMWPDMPLEFVKLKDDDKGVHFGGFVNNTLLSVVSLFFKDNKAQFRKLAVVELEQGKGYGSELLQYVITYAKAKKVTSIWCNARANKTDFYEKFGMVKTNITYVKGGVNFVIMEYIITF